MDICAKCGKPDFGMEAVATVTPQCICRYKTDEKYLSRITQLENEIQLLNAKIAGGVRVYAFEAWGDYKCDQYSKPNATLLLDEVAISKKETPNDD